MTAWEAIRAASVSINDMYHTAYGVVKITWSQTAEDWTQHLRGYGIAAGNDCCHRQEDEQYLLGFVVLEQHIDNTGIEQHPFPLTTIEVHELIPEQRVVTVEGKKELSVKVDKILYHILELRIWNLELRISRTSCDEELFNYEFGITNQRSSTEGR